MRILSIVALSLTALVGVAPLAAASADLVVKESANSVKDTIDKLAAALEAKGVKVVARVDHAAGAKAVGMELAAAEVLIFGNPRLGTPLMQAKPEIGLDLPMKAFAWQGADGKVRLAYTSPEALKKRYGIGDRDDTFKAMAQALEAFSTAATAKAP